MEKKPINLLLIGKNIPIIKKAMHIENSSILTKNNFAEAIKFIKKISFDVVLLSVKYSERKTIENINSILKINPDCLIIIISQIPDYNRYIKFISAGAEDCIYIKHIHNLNQKIQYSLARRNNSIYLMNKNLREKYHLINNNIKDFIWIMSPDLKFLYLSPSIINLRGFTAEEVMNQKFEQLFTPESFKSVKKFINDFLIALNQGKIYKDSYKLEVYQPHKNGTIIPVEIIVNPIYDDNNNLKYFFGVSRDITERKKYEESLIKAQEDYKLIIENQNDLIVKLDPEFKITFVNPQYNNTFNIKEEEIIGKQFTPLIHPDDLDSALKALSTLLKHPYKIIHTERMLTPKGWLWFEWSDKAIVDKKGIVKEIISVGRNIHEQKIADDKILESERKFSNLIQNLPGMVYSCENVQDWTMEIVSNGCFALTGYTPEELQRDKVVSYNDIIHPDDRNYVWNAVQESLERHQPFELKYRIITKQGIEKWVWERGSFAYRNEFKKDILEGFIFDITDKVKAEISLAESEQQFRFISENADDLMYIYEFTPVPRFKYVSPSATKITGYTPEEHYADPQLGFKLIHPDDLHILQELSEGNITNQPIVLRLVKKDGTIIWTEQKNVPLYDDKGNLYALQGIARDITERKLSEEKIHQSEEKYRLIFSNVNDALILMDLRSKIIDCNQKSAEILGSDISEMIGTEFIQLGILPKEVTEEVLKKFKDALLRKETKFEFNFINKKGVEYTLDCTTRRIDSHQKISGIVVFCHDITKRKQIENDLRKRNEFIQNVLDNLPIGVALNNIDNTKATYMNKKFVEIYGWPREALTDIMSFFKNVYPNEKYRKQLYDKVMADIQSKDPEKMHWEELEATTQDGSTKIINAVNIPLFEQNTMVSTVMDVTKEKLTERSLIANQAKLNSIFKAAPIGIGLVINRIFIDVNDTLCNMVGYHKDELIGRKSRILYPTDEDYNYVGTEKYEQIKRNGTRTVETKFITKSGKILDILLSSTPLNQKDIEEGVIFTAMDITLWKQFEKELIKREEKYRNLFESIHDAIVVTDTNRNIIDCNSAFTKLFGYSIEEIKGRNALLLYENEQTYWDMKEKIIKSLKSGEPFTKINNFITKHKKTLIGETIFSFMKDIAGNIVGYIGIIRDITEQNAIENELKEHQERLNNIINHSNELFYFHDTAHNLIYVSPQSESILGYKPNEMKVNWTTLTTDNPINQIGYEKTVHAIETGIKQNPYLLELYKKDKSKIIVEVDESPVKDEDGIVIGITGALRDITHKYNQDIKMKNLASFVELNPYPIISFNTQAVITYANPAARYIFGVSISKDTNLPEIFPEHDINDFLITLVDGTTYNFQIKSEMKTYLFIVKGIPETKTGYIFGADVTSLTQIQKDIDKSHNQLQAYAGYLQSIRESERLSIARELHDDFSQILSALKMFTSSILIEIESKQNQDTAYIKSQITEMSLMLDKAIQSVRDVLKKLSSEILEDFGLIEAIKLMLEEFNNKSGINCEFICNLDNIQLNQTQQIAVYRIYQEALSNIKHHSNAKKSKLSIELSDNNYIFTISDNGQGFDENVFYKKESFGLIGMRERANACGGELIVDSKINVGTTIKIIIPINK